MTPCIRQDSIVIETSSKIIATKQMKVPDCLMQNLGINYFNFTYFQTIQQWQKVFWVTSLIYIVCATVFLIFASAENQPWNYENAEKKVNNVELNSKPKVSV